LLCLSCSIDSTDQSDNKAGAEIGELLEQELDLGEAIIWYLGHSGWAIKTKNHLLIFDYWERVKPKDSRSLSRGTINPKEIKDQRVLVFVSHAHGDHFDPVIKKWRKKVKDITYIFGWQKKESDAVCFEFKRQKKKVGDVEIQNIVHDYDQIPESAFLVNVDGLVIFHSGDHGNGPPPFRPLFLDNIKYIKEKAPEIDLAIIPLFGEEFHVAEQLNATFTFPMHEGGRESRYKKFAAAAKEMKIDTQVICAERTGHRFEFVRDESRLTLHAETRPR
jgi:L-ascorbate metabolism protein UlaG (beta-lactamase superfamily)